MTGKPTILVIVGVTGDLSKRKLLPALARLAKNDTLPEKFHIIGVTRQSVTVHDFLEEAGQADNGYLREHLSLFQMQLHIEDDYVKLKLYLQSIQDAWGANAQWLFYLSVPPQASQQIIRLMGASGLNDDTVKLLLEKPFGTDLLSAEELIQDTSAVFSESQLYRIDHYLAKEMSQNLLVFRDSNALFKRTWNHDFIESIHITASEHIGIEGRAAFYEQTGALRDVLQSHLLQLAALVLMDMPTHQTLAEVPARRLRALQFLHISQARPLGEVSVRGQYDGYLEEVGVPHSKVETFISAEFESHDPRWKGVPVYIHTGKALDKKCTEIRLTYIRDSGHEANRLAIRLQPEEGITLDLLSKVPGYEWRVETHSLGMQFKDHFKDMPEAYEQVLLDAIMGVHTFFTTSQEVLESWRILDPLQRAWEMNVTELIHYKKGTPVQDIALGTSE